MVAANKTGKQPRPGARHTNKRPTSRDDAEKVVEHLLHSGDTPPLVLAILGQAMVEYRLEALVRSRITRKDNDTWWLLTQDGGPFSTFSSKIKMAYAYKLIDDSQRRNLEIIRVIRNAFAHAHRLIDFDDEDIIAEIKKIKTPHPKSMRYEELKNAQSVRINGQTSYFTLCFSLYFILGDKDLKKVKAQTRYYERKVRNRDLREFSSGGLLGGLGAAAWRDLGGKPNMATMSYPDYASRLVDLGLNPLPELKLPSKKDD